MKRNIILAAVTMLIATTGCQKSLQDNQFNHDQLNEVGINNIKVDCTPITLSGSITSNMTLLTGKTYLLDGVVDVKSGATLTIQPGTLILGKSSVESALVIDKTAQINAVGTATSPIIFTSDKAPGSRAAGDWLGVFIMGNAPNNQSNSLSFNVGPNSYTAGGTSSASSAGSLQYVQIHFAGKGSSTGDRLTQSALVMASVGSGMTIRNIQVTNSKFDALGIWGGELGVKELFTYKSGRTDFAISQGFRGKMQSLFGFRDNAVYHTTESYGMDITNNVVGGNNAPYTYPVISNATLLGSSYCSNGDLNYKDAIVFRLNGNARIYNSVVESFPQYGLLLNDANIVSKTAAGGDQLIFSHNSIENIGTADYRALITLPATWASVGGCNFFPTDDMQSWIEGTTPAACSQSGNQFGFGTTGYYQSTLCGTDKCNNFPNLYINTATTLLDDPDYSSLSGFFDQPLYRGALQSSTDTWMKSTWLTFCPESDNYCL